MFESIFLEPKQKDLLAILVDAVRKGDQAQNSFWMQGSSIQHAGLPGGRINVNVSDICALADENLLTRRNDLESFYFFGITPKGFRYYDEMKQQATQPLERMEQEVRSFLEADPFQRKYAAAYKKWAQAEKTLRTGDSESQLTTIGHLCREALQEFAATLVAKYQPPNVDPDAAHTVARIRAVLNVKNDQTGTTTKSFLDMLPEYLGTVSDLIQRQEHGGQKEGQPLVWEDGRRVVFQTAIVMFEIDTALTVF